MSYIRIVSAALLALALVACNLLQSKEEQCLQSGRLSMKDPDSGKVVENLGGRGDAFTQSAGGFWLRYSATNSYGGRVAGNMACENSKGKWVRSENLERMALAAARVQIGLLGLKALNAKSQKLIDDLKTCKPRECAALRAKIDTSDATGDRAIQEVHREADKLANTAVYEDTGPL